MKLVALLLLCALAYLPPSVANATTNLPVVCFQDQDMQNQPINACKYSNQRFAAATATSWVRNCTVANCANQAPSWRRFDTVLAHTFVEVCTADKSPGAPIENGECQGSTSGKWGAMKYVDVSLVARVPQMVGTFTATPSSGVSPLAVVLEWNVPDLVGDLPCQGSGNVPAWNVPHTKAGRETHTVSADSTFTLTCVQIEAHGVLLSWKNPTHYTDGTIMADLGSTLINWGTSFIDQRPVLQMVVQVDKSVQNYIMEDLKPSQYYFGLKSQTLKGVQSDMSSIVSYEVKASSNQPPQRYTSTKDVTVTKKPEAPTELTAGAAPAATAVPEQLSVREFSWVKVGQRCKPDDGGLFLIKADEKSPLTYALCKLRHFIRGAILEAAGLDATEVEPPASD